jgi:hypothetical protein
MDMSTINWLAVLVAGAAMWVLGSLWFSPVLFAKPWIKACGFTDAQMKQKSNLGLMLVTSFVLGLLMAVNLAFYHNSPTTTGAFGAAAGAAAGIGWVGLAFAMSAMFEKKPFAYTLITGGYYAVSLTLMGFIIGAWR